MIDSEFKHSNISQEDWDVRANPDQLKTVSNEMFLSLHQDLKALQDDMNDLAENEYDYDFLCVSGIYEFYIRYIHARRASFVDFDDYILSFIQDKSEFSAKQLLERIWREGNNVLELYYSKKNSFDEFDEKGFLITAIESAFFSEYHDILCNLNKAMPKTLKEFYYHDQPIIGLPLTDIEVMITQFRFNMIEVQKGINREVSGLAELLELIRYDKTNPLVFSQFMEELTDYVDTIGKFIGKESYQERVTDTNNSTSDEIPPFVIEGALLDDLYEICNSTVVYSCSRDYFKEIINGERPEFEDSFRQRDILHLNKSYHLINQMSFIIPRRQYEHWREKVFRSQNIKKDVYNKKWSAITQKQTKENVEFINKVQQIVDKHKLK